MCNEVADDICQLVEHPSTEMTEAQGESTTLSSAGAAAAAAAVGPTATG